MFRGGNPFSRIESNGIRSPWCLSRQELKKIARLQHEHNKIAACLSGLGRIARATFCTTIRLTTLGPPSHGLGCFWQPFAASPLPSQARAHDFGTCCKGCGIDVRRTDMCCEGHRPALAYGPCSCCWHKDPLPNAAELSHYWAWFGDSNIL